MGCCREFAERFVAGISALMLILGLVVLGLSIALATKLGEEFDELDLNSPVVVSIVFSSMLLIFSLIGLFGALKDIKILLFIYFIGSFLISVGVIAIGGVLLGYSSNVENIGKFENLNGDIEETVLAFQLAVFSTCCSESGANADDLGCATNGNTNPCFNDIELFDKFVNFLGNENATTCQVLQDVEVDGKPVINEASPGEDDLCAEGANAFVQAVTDFIKDNLVKLAVANLVIGIIMLVLMLSTCVLFWTKERGDKGKY